MARSIYIDSLVFKILSLGRDICIIGYFDINNYKRGTNISPKNCYMNPCVTFMCLFTNISCCVCINCETWKGGCKEKIFLSRGSKEGSALNDYYKYLSNMFSGMTEILRVYVRPDF